MSNPEDEPLGGKPILPAPTFAAQRRAHPLFKRYLAETRSTTVDERSDGGQTDWAPTPHDAPTRIVHRSSLVSTPLPIDDAPTRTERPFPNMRFESGRRYDNIIAFIQAVAGPLEQTPTAPVHYGEQESDSGVSSLPPAFGDYDSGPFADDEPMAFDEHESTRVDEDELARLDALANPVEPTVIARVPEVKAEAREAGVEPTVVGTRPDRPPPFAPMVRPSPPPRKGPESVDQATLESMVDTSMLVANPDGSAAFEIAFDDDVFQNLACSISVTPQGVVATFKAPDVNTRRLLEAEAGKLRVRLSERGLRVAEVRVESE